MNFSITQASRQPRLIKPPRFQQGHHTSHASVATHPTASSHSFWAHHGDCVIGGAGVGAILLAIGFRKKIMAFVTGLKKPGR